jgi:hypothetical protein
MSNQAEGIAVDKNLSWGITEESARSIIILTDMMAAAAVADNALAVTAPAHELGHVHDEFARGVAVGFPKSHLPPDARNWPKVRAYIANMVWASALRNRSAAAIWAAKIYVTACSTIRYTLWACMAGSDNQSRTTSAGSKIWSLSGPVPLL